MLLCCDKSKMPDNPPVVLWKERLRGQVRFVVEQLFQIPLVRMIVTLGHDRLAGMKAITSVLLPSDDQTPHQTVDDYEAERDTNLDPFCAQSSSRRYSRLKRTYLNQLYPKGVISEGSGLTATSNMVSRDNSQQNSHAIRCYCRP